MLASPKRDRVVITGMGIASPLADNLADHRKKLLDNVGGVTAKEVDFLGPQAVGECHFDGLKYQTKRTAGRTSFLGAISIYSAMEALADAKLELADDEGDYSSSQIGIFLGTTTTGNTETEQNLLQLQNSAPPYPISPLLNNQILVNSCAGEVALHLGSTGPHYVLGGACAAGSLGIIQAAQMLYLGEIEVAICGGVSDAAQCAASFSGFLGQGALAKLDANDPEKSCRPLDQNRTGVVISNGAGMLILEKYSKAVARGAPIYGEILSYAINSDKKAYNRPSAEGQAQCLRLALKRAKLAPHDIHLVNLHATGTMTGDKVEVAALKEVFKNGQQTFYNAAKGHLGHTLGASGAIELIGNILGFKDQRIHPILNLDDIDPECSLENLVVGKPYESQYQTILKSSMGFYGINTAIIIKAVSGP